MSKTSVIVVGGLNTDITVLGLNKLPKSGEDAYGTEIRIGPGGKSRNIAQMIASLTSPGTVAMIGKTSKDVFELWKPPFDALVEAGVNVQHIKQLEFSESGKYPGIALIGVSKEGERFGLVGAGIIDDFNEHDLDDAEELFNEMSKNGGMLAFSLELPLKTAIHAIQKANKHHIKVLLDPGGVKGDTNFDELLDQEIYLLKPNEHEAKILTGVEVRDLDSAHQAAQILLQKGVKNVFITHGQNGAYFFNGTTKKHYPIPDLEEAKERDATGAGDQTMAALCASLVLGKDLEEALRIAVIAGTLQFRKIGIQPLTKAELEEYI